MVKSISDWILTHYFMWNEFDSKKNLKVSKRIVKGKNKKAILFFPYWTGTSALYESLANKFPDSTLVFFDYPNEVMSADIKVSLMYIKRILKMAINVIKSLRKKGIEEIVLVGSSFGANIALKVSTVVPVEKVVLNMIDKNYARSIFESSALIILKRKLKKRGYNLKNIDKVYSFISTDTLVPKIKNKKKVKFLICASDNDIFCTYSQFKSELKVFDKYGINYILRRNHFFGHILGIYWNVVFSDRIKDFIED